MSELDSRYVRFREDLCLDTRLSFNPHIDYRAVHKDPTGKLRPLGFVSDWDGVWTQCRVIDYVLEDLRKDPKIAPLIPSIVEEIKLMHADRNISYHLKNIEEKFKQTKLTEEKFIEANIFAYEKARRFWTKGYDKLASTLANEDVGVGFISGSTDVALELLIKELYLPHWLLRATHFSFKDGEFIGMSPQVGDAKYFSKYDLLKEITGYGTGFHIGLTDDPIDKALGYSAGINPYLFIGKEYEKIADVTIHLPLAQKDMTIISDWFWRWNYFITNTLLESPQDYLTILHAMQDLILSYKNEDYEKFFKSMNFFLSKRITFPRAKLNSLIAQFYVTKNESRRKIIFSQIFNEIAEKTAELSAGEAYIKQAIKYVSSLV